MISQGPIYGSTFGAPGLGAPAGLTPYGTPGVGIDVDGDGIVDFRTQGGVGIDVNGDGLTDFRTGGIGYPTTYPTLGATVAPTYPALGATTAFPDPYAGSFAGSVLPPAYPSYGTPVVGSGIIGSNGGVQGPLPGIGIDVDGDGITDYRVGTGSNYIPQPPASRFIRRHNDVRPYRDYRTLRY